MYLAIVRGSEVICEEDVEATFKLKQIYKDLIFCIFETPDKSHYPYVHRQNILKCIVVDSIVVSHHI